MRWVRWAALSGGALAGLVPATSWAAGAPPTYALSWVRAEGAEGCPSGRALASEVEQRLGRAVFDAAAERSIEVEVTRFGQRYRSDVYVRDSAGHAIGHRLLESDEPECGALVSATALAVALVIDPEALARPPTPGSTLPAPAPAASEPAAPAMPEPAPPPAAEAPVVAPPAPTPPPASLPAPPRRTLLTISLRAVLAAGVVPAASPGVELSFSARPHPRWGFQLAAAYLASQTVTGGVGSLDIGLTRLSALLSFDVARSERARWLFALGPTLGALHLAVRAPAPVTDAGDFWFAAAELATELQVAVTDDVFLGVGGAILAPLGRQAFAVRGQSEAVWAQPALGGLGFLGGGARFP